MYKQTAIEMATDIASEMARLDNYDKPSTFYFEFAYNYVLAETARQMVTASTANKLLDG